MPGSSGSTGRPTPITKPGKPPPAWRIYTCSPSCTAAPWRSFSSDPPNSKRRAAASAAALAQFMEEAFYGRGTGRRAAGPLAPVCWFFFLAAARLLRAWGAAPSRLTALSKRWCPPGTSAPASFLKKGCYVPVGRCPTADRVGRREEQKLYVRFLFITLFLRLKAILQA